MYGIDIVLFISLYEDCSTTDTELADSESLA